MKTALLIIDLDTTNTPYTIDIIGKINGILPKYDFKIFCLVYGKVLDYSLVYGGEIVIYRNSLSLYKSDSCFYDAQIIKKETKLHTILQKNNITDLHICGIGSPTNTPLTSPTNPPLTSPTNAPLTSPTNAPLTTPTNNVLLMTSIDSVKFGYKTYIISDLCINFPRVHEYLENYGVGLL